MFVSTKAQKAGKRGHPISREFPSSAALRQDQIDVETRHWILLWFSRENSGLAEVQKFTKRHVARPLHNK